MHRDAKLAVQRERGLRLVKRLRVVLHIFQDPFGLVEVREQEGPIFACDHAVRRRDGKPALGGVEGRATGFDLPQPLQDVTGRDEATPHRDDLTLTDV